jgi:hypothetical protein
MLSKEKRIQGTVRYERSASYASRLALFPLPTQASNAKGILCCSIQFARSGLSLEERKRFGP